MPNRVDFEADGSVYSSVPPPPWARAFGERWIYSLKISAFGMCKTGVSPVTGYDSSSVIPGIARYVSGGEIKTSPAAIYQGRKAYPWIDSSVWPRLGMQYLVPGRHLALD